MGKSRRMTFRLTVGIKESPLYDLLQQEELAVNSAPSGD